MHTDTGKLTARFDAHKKTLHVYTYMHIYMRAHTHTYIHTYIPCRYRQADGTIRCTQEDIASQKLIQAELNVLVRKARQQEEKEQQKKGWFRCVCMFVCVCMYTHVCVYVSMYACVLVRKEGNRRRKKNRRRAGSGMCVYIRMCVCVYIYIYTHTHTHIYIHACMHAFS
jgi:hypothetical protein